MIKTPVLLFISIYISLFSTAYSATLKVNAPGLDCKSNKLDFCSIQEAINFASDKDKINIASGRYFENIVVNKHISLSGNSGGTNTIIDGTKSGSVIVINPGSKVTIKHIQLTNGKAENGGGILNKGSLMLSNVEVVDNVATYSGGGIFNARSISGSLFISDSNISHNKSLGDDKYNVKYGGGGIYNNSPLNINKSSISDNYAEDNGGGIYSVYSGRKSPTSSEIIAEEIGLSAAPKRKNTLTRKADPGAVSLNKVKINHNIAGSGGGINLQGVMNINKSSIHKNQAANHNRGSGGGIFAHLDTSLHINNTTISHNEAVFRGGGIRFYSTKVGSLNNVSVIYNKLTTPIGQGAGLYLENYTKQFDIRNSLIAENNIMQNKISDCYGNIKSRGYNFVGFINRCKWIENEGDILGSKAKIDANITWDEQFNRYILSKESSLINKGSPFGCKNENDRKISKDQFNKSRNDKRCDIGAVEF